MLHTLYLYMQVERHKPLKYWPESVLHYYWCSNSNRMLNYESFSDGLLWILQTKKSTNKSPYWWFLMKLRKLCQSLCKTFVSKLLPNSLIVGHCFLLARNRKYGRCCGDFYIFVHMWPWWFWIFYLFQFLKAFNILLKWLNICYVSKLK